jgi:hypothetical protein
MDTAYLWVIQTAWVGALGCCASMAWKDRNHDPVATGRRVLKTALRVADLPQKVAAAEVGMDEGALSRRLDDGGAFFARLLHLSFRYPAFGAALGYLIREVAREANESAVDGAERLIRESRLDHLPQREPKKCEGDRSRSTSSAA